LPKDLADQIVERTDGIPLFIEELTKAVVESGAHVDAGDRYTASGPSVPLIIPETLHASLLARLDRLAPVQEVAQIGAALGRQFSHEVISAVASMSQQRLEDALAQLVCAELIFQRGSPPDAEYTFKHALVQDAAYSTLLRGQRQQLHARIVATLEHRFTEIVIAQPALLARHCMEAGQSEQAVRYYLKAGQQMLGRSPIQAEALLRKGLNILRGLPDTTEHQQLELGFCAAMASALPSTRGAADLEIGEIAARARQLSATLRLPPLAMALRAEAIHHILRAEHRLGLQRASELIALGEANGDGALIVLGSWESAITCFHLGEFTAMQAHAERAVNRYDPAQRPFFAAFGDDPEIYALGLLARSLVFLGYPDQARARNEDMLATARRCGLADPLAFALGNILLCKGLVQADPRESLERALELAALSAQQGLAYWAAYADLVRGSNLSILGDTDEGLQMLKNGLTAYRATGSIAGLPGILASLAGAYRRAGQPREGLKLLDEAAQQIEATQDRFGEVSLHCVRGDLLLGIGDHAAAEASFRASATVEVAGIARINESSPPLA
jgi:tetratricopeptide (TPR) repeat protein